MLLENNSQSNEITQECPFANFQKCRGEKCRLWLLRKVIDNNQIVEQANEGCCFLEELGGYFQIKNLEQK